MSYYPHGQPPPYDYGPPHHYGPPPPPHHPPPHGHYPPPNYYPPAAVGYYLPTMMVPVPVSDPQTTYVTNHIYHGETVVSQEVKEIEDTVQVAENSGEFDWVPTTSTLANTLTGRAVSGGHEGWDGSPLWIIRAWHNGDQVPGKLSVRHNTATIAYSGKEVPVQNIEVLCSKPEALRWIPASNGNVPPSAIEGGKTKSGEVLYIGRARHQLSITPGKIQPSLEACYISFAGTEVAHKTYDVLCRAS